MADFTRFISYLYEYRAGERSRNQGFARVEVRKNICRITVCLNHGQVSQWPMELYGYLNEDGEVRLLLLGAMEAGSRERRWQFPADSLGGAGIGLKRLSGLILMNRERSGYLLSVWTGGGLSGEEIRSARKWGEAEENRISAASVPGEPLPAPEEPVFALEKEAAPASAEGVVFPPDETRLEAEESGPGPSVGETSGPGAVLAPGPGPSAGVAAASDPGAVSAPGSGPSAGVAPSPDPVPDSWRALCELFPAARPFEPSVWEVLCISLQDIGRLPPENWTWGSNHFLLHAFYQYRHLILARKRTENRVYLGVPGEFGEKEKFMAAMFGLRQFQRERQGKSDKGYWLAPVRLDGQDPD